MNPETKWLLAAVVCGVADGVLRLFVRSPLAEWILIGAMIVCLVIALAVIVRRSS